MVSSNAAAVGTDGSSLSITAVVKDANNVAISGATVAWQTSAGSLSGQSSVTNASGVATATFTPTGVNPATAPVATISVASGSGTAAQTGSVQVGISPTTTSIEITAAQASIGTGGEQVLITAFVKDGNNLAKVGAPVVERRRGPFQQRGVNQQCQWRGHGGPGCRQ
ncbi:Ig-like domain-containing protein [Paucibacter sp. O1-1]|nr:Ig-like domain-containing protein [Paucibacter sp. O1-1]MDA3829927.1 Ig-like domain-containing protein [Paucibacter sp. O1-1]